jgi:hypothetical protein
LGIIKTEAGACIFCSLLLRQDRESMNTVWIIFLGALTAAGCSASPVSPDPDVDEITPGSTSSAEETGGVVGIRFDEIVTYADLELRWLEVEDSRCPIGDNCFWEGDVKVTLEATRTGKRGKGPVEFRLTLHARREPGAVSVYGYELGLLDVAPLPRAGVIPERSDYMAEIGISEAFSAPLSSPRQ